MLTDTQRSTILTLRRAGKPCSEIAKIMNKRVHAIQQFVYRHGLSFKIASQHPSGKRYNWAAIQRFYDSGNDRYACLVKFGISPQAWDAAGKHKRLKLRTAVPRKDALVKGRRISSSMLRQHLLKLGFLTGKCKLCGISSWMEKPLTLQLDHVNGDPSDNRPENIRELCPNCHSQTPTFGTRGGRNKTKSPDFVVEVKRFHAEGHKQLWIASKMGCSPATVAHIISGWKRWRYR